MSTSLSKRLTVFFVLALLMSATRFGHGSSLWPPPDASWAVFFIGGFYLAREWRWAFTALLVEAVVIDYAAIRYYGYSNYCETLAYWFNLPAYVVLWLGGAWLQQRYQRRPIDVVRLVASFTASLTICFLITQASFYWLTSGDEPRSLGGWWSNLTLWYGPFVGTSGVYVAVAAAVEIALSSRTAARRAPKRADLQPDRPRPA
jgi:hypothetical protein